jgi:hypothetical protein
MSSLFKDQIEVLTDKKKNVSFSSDTDLPSVGRMLFEIIFSQKKNPFTTL